MGLDNPKSLQRAVFYVIGKIFCICGGEEQRNLGPAQFICSYSPDCITYAEHGSKNYSAQAKNLRFENKEVPCPAVPENRPKCLVFLMDLYLAKLPKFAFGKNILYLRQKRTIPSNSEEAWYDNVAVGLRTMVKDMCAKAQICGKTNHSRRPLVQLLFSKNMFQKRSFKR